MLILGDASYYYSNYYCCFCIYCLNKIGFMVKVKAKVPVESSILC